MSGTPEKERERRREQPRSTSMKNDKVYNIWLFLIHYNFLFIDTLKAASKMSKNRQKAEAYILR